MVPLYTTYSATKVPLYTTLHTLLIFIGLPPTFEEFGGIASGIWGDMGGASTILGLFHLAKVPIPDFKGPCKTLHGCGCSNLYHVWCRFANQFYNLKIKNAYKNTNEHYSGPRYELTYKWPKTSRVLDEMD